MNTDLLNEQDIITLLTCDNIRRFVHAFTDPKQVSLATDGAIDTSREVLDEWEQKNVVARYLMVAITHRLKVTDGEVCLLRVGVNYTHILVSYVGGSTLSIEHSDKEPVLGWIYWLLAICDGVSAGVPRRWLTADQVSAFLTIVEELDHLWLSQG